MAFKRFTSLVVMSDNHVTILDLFKKIICLIQELRKALQQLQEELQNKSQQLRAREAEKYNEIRTQEQNIQHLNHSLSHKEHLLQVSLHDFNENWAHRTLKFVYINLRYYSTSVESLL